MTPAANIPEDVEVLQSMMLENYQDAIFVSIDVEGGRGKKENEFRIYEMGISMLDSRRLLHEEHGIDDDIINRHFVIGGSKKLMKAARENLFGISEAISADNIPSVLRNAVNIDDTASPSSPNQPKLRRVILVGHSLWVDIHLLQIFGIDITLHPTVIRIFDTQSITMSLLGKGYSVELLLRTFCIPYKNLHSATNDANFKLRGLIMLTHRSLRRFPSPKFEGTIIKTDESRKLSWLQVVARPESPDVALRNEVWRKSRGLGFDVLDEKEDFDVMLGLEVES
ncbi:uncharacterized protein RAG0_00940 [Rhynchosporium agropyri]|uniref:Gfd2/YDR514C-like C-terminal domain-containing protein n=1 Tax=Rhynchosporium agropyri TaxID=914238 RepID=A0A1E1JUT6_9HELO|nr:uncharacterized protein RAG0_00940 [Rhynchosporium agropyri]